MIVELTRHGATWRIEDPGGIIGRPIREGRPYEWRLLDEIAGLGLVGTALDVGAHVGNHALFLAAVCGLRVYAFEPDPATFERLAANVRRNPDLDVLPVPAAAGVRTERARLGPAMTVIPDPDGDVQIVAIDDFLTIDDLVLVKIDVEGAEPAVLAGMVEHLDRCRPVVYAETHTKTAGRRIAGVLEPLGYRPDGAVRMGSTMERWRWV